MDNIENRLQAVLEKVEALKEDQKLSQEKVGKLVGVSGAIISQLRNGKYPGDVEKQVKTLEEYFSIKSEYEDTYKELDYVRTSISGKAYDVIKLCHIKGGLAIFAGDAGIGKTKAAKKYAADNPTNSLYIALNPTFTSVKSLLKLLSQKLGARPERLVDDMWLAIRERLSDGTVLIFDEAQHLPYKTIETLRSFSDSFAEDGQTLGICFIGNTETVRRLGVKQKAEFAQISNRTKQKIIYSARNIKREDISMLFPLLAQQGMNAEIDFLWGVSRTHQALRGAVNLFSNAYDNNDYTLSGLAKMAKHMEIDLTGLDIKKIKGESA